MSEKMEKRLKIALNCFVAIAVIVVVLCVWSNSKYSPNDHSAEQGHLPVYVTPNNTNNTNNLNQPDEDYLEDFQATHYTPYSYNEILDACNKKDMKKIKIKGTVYSVLETSSSILYSIADADGNYYSIVDESNGQLLKLSKTSVVYVYCMPSGLSKMNNKDIPQLKAMFFEESN